MQKAKFLRWIKQPSTWKSFIIVGSLLGASISQERVKEIVETGLVLYAGIACFWDEN